MLFMIFLWAVWGAVVDFRYQKRGGIKPEKREWILLLVAVVASIIGVAVVWQRGAEPTVIRDTAAALGMFITIVWEFNRWRVRFSTST